LAAPPPAPRDTPVAVPERPLPVLAVRVARAPDRARADPPRPQLAGLDRVEIPDLPALQPTPSVRLEARDPFQMRRPEARRERIAKLGGSQKTEAAVKRALDWFSRHQEKDGRWDIMRHGGQGGHDIAATSFALLCYYGWGAKHTERGPYREHVQKALTWLVGQMKRNGDLSHGAGNGMYDQGVATLALAEAYGVTKDPALREPVERAVAFIVRAQNKKHGGWRYKPGSRQGDTSVVGWQVMALASARMAGLHVPEKSFALASRWLDRVGGGKHGGLYGYQSKSPKPAMVAEGMFCRQLLGVPPDGPKMGESAAYLKTFPPGRKSTNYYYWYYACLALYQHQGPVWEAWNKEMKKVLLGSQEQRGKNAGSWDPRGSYGNAAGRVVTTAMATLSLEVYYRYLPIYRLPARQGEPRPR
jgi:hypothetical protein